MIRIVKNEETRPCYHKMKEVTGMRKKKVLVVGAMYSLNFGDGVICRTVADIIQKKLGMQAVVFGISGKDSFQQAERQVLSAKMTWKKKIAKLFPFNLYIAVRSTKRLKEKLRRCDPAEYDMVVFAGGQLFMQCFVDYIYEIVKWADSAAVPVVFNGCGIGGLTWAGKRKLQKVFQYSNVKSVTLRDGVDQFAAVFCAGKQPPERIYDPVVEVASFYMPRPKKKVTLGIGVIHPINFRKECVDYSDEDYATLMKDAVAWCRRKNVEFEFFTNGDPLDAQYCLWLTEECGCRDHAAPRPVSPEDLLETVTKYDRILSCRLHSHIIAASYGIPTAAIVWDRKVEEFMALLERRELCLPLTKDTDTCKMEEVLGRLFKVDQKCEFLQLALTSQNLERCCCEFEKLQ